MGGSPELTEPGWPLAPRLDHPWRADQRLVVRGEPVEIVDKRVELAPLSQIQREDRVGNALERDRRGQLHIAFIAFRMPADRLHDVHAHVLTTRGGEDRGGLRADLRIDTP